MALSRVHADQVSQQILDDLPNLVRGLQPDVVRIRWSLGEDWSGDPAIFFRITLSDAAGRRNDLAELTGAISERIREELHLADGDHVPYFNFRGESEQKRLKDPEWD